MPHINIVELNPNTFEIINEETERKQTSHCPLDPVDKLSANIEEMIHAAIDYLTKKAGEKNIAADTASINRDEQHGDDFNFNNELNSSIDKIRTLEVKNKKAQIEFINALKEFNESIKYNIKLQENSGCNQDQILNSSPLQIGKKTITLLQSLKFEKNSVSEDLNKLASYHNECKKINNNEPRFAKFFKSLGVLIVSAASYVIGAAAGAVAGLIYSPAFCTSIGAAIGGIAKGKKGAALGALAGLLLSPIGILASIGIGATVGSHIGLNKSKKMLGIPPYEKISNHLIFKPAISTNDLERKASTFIRENNEPQIHVVRSVKL